MWCGRLSVVLIFAARLAGCQRVSESNGALPTFAELLKQHNIQLTQPALVEALRNGDPDVRYLAAQQLAEEKATETIPAIKAALASETVPLTRMNVAFALAQLGESTGFDILEENCRNHDQGARIREQSALYMLNLHRESSVCWSAVLDVLEGGSNGYKMQAVTLLPQFHNLSKEESGRVFVGLVKALHDPYPLVRLDAGRALADVGDGRALTELREAVANEQEEDIRPQLEQDLKILQDKMRR